MQPIAHNGMIRIELLKIHVQVDRISGRPQIHLVHIVVVTCLIHKNATKMQGNAHQ